MNAALCYKQFVKSCKREEKEKMHSRLGGDLNLLPTEWQPHVLTTKHCHIHMQTFFCSIYQAVVSVDLVCKEKLNLMKKVVGLLVKVRWV